MKKINKPLSFVLALMTCLCLAGCGDDNEADTPTSNPTNSVAAPNNSASGENGEPTASNTAEIVMEPVVTTISDISGNRLEGFGFHKSTVYGNAFSIIYSYGSTDGNIINNAPISIVPIGMNSLDDILATEPCQGIKKEELAEADFGDGTTGWMSTEEAAEKLAKNCGDYSFDALFEEMMVIELTASGVSQQDALVQARIKLANVGLGDER